MTMNIPSVIVRSRRSRQQHQDRDGHHTHGQDDADDLLCSAADGEGCYASLATVEHRAPLKLGASAALDG
jgi:hypothetical protein